MMSSKYFQFSVNLIRYTSCNCATLLHASLANHFPKRWAGHSKWQNIKSTKEAADRNRSTAFQRITQQIATAIKAGGRDVAGNSKLKSLVEEARKINMPKATLEKALKAGTTDTVERPYWVVFSGPKGIVLGLEVEFANKNPSYLSSKLSPFGKKLKLKIEPYFSHLCTERGIIVAVPSESNENVYEKALEDALEIGIDEVYEEDDKSLLFECSPDRIDSLANQLVKKGYNVWSLSTELDFKELIKLEEDEVNQIEKLVSAVKSNFAEVQRASYNLAKSNSE